MDPQPEHAEVEPPAVRARVERNPTLLWGGGLMTMAGLSALLFALTLAPMPALLDAALFGAACVIFGYGFRGGGSVVGGSVWGRVGLTGLAVMPLVADASSLLGSFTGGSAAMLGLATAGTGATVFAIISTSAIVRQRAVPGLWRLVPVVGIALVEITNLITQGSVERTQPLDLGFALIVARVVTATVWISYGVAALLLARKVGHLESATRPVIDPGEANLVRRS